MNFYTSDLHFWHKGVIEFCKRPWATPEEMNEGLIQNWNSVVGPTDSIRILGDVFFCGTKKIGEIAHRLNGIKHLYLGNHDWDKINKNKLNRWVDEFGFASVQKDGAVHLEGFDELVNLSHFPYLNEGDHTELQRYPEHRLINNGKYLLHGHVHSYWLKKDKMINVGVDVWGWKPVSEQQILELIRGET